MLTVARNQALSVWPVRPGCMALGCRVLGPALSSTKTYDEVKGLSCTDGSSISVQTGCLGRWRRRGAA